MSAPVCHCGHRIRAHVGERTNVWITRDGYQSYHLLRRQCTECGCPAWKEQRVPRRIVHKFIGIEDGVAVFACYGIFGKRGRRELVDPATRAAD